MKIAELCLSPDKGGLELYVRRKAQWFSRQNVACTAVVAPGTPLEALVRTDGSRYFPLKAAFRWFPLFAARRLARWIDAEGIDVVHLNWGKDLSLAVLARTFARRSVRIVYTRQMAITRSKRDGYHRWLYRHVDLFLTITRQLQHEARRFLPLPPERIRVLYHGVAAPSSPDAGRCTALRERANMPAGRFVVGLFGRIEPAKGQHVLVDALTLLVARGCDVGAVLFGHPMMPGYLAELQARVARLGLERHVHYYGFHPQPTDIMGCLDAVVLATCNETFGLVLAEAMRAGVAVIGTDAGGVPEIIEHDKTGLLVPPRDPAALADAIERLVRDRELRMRLAAAGKASADARFDEAQHFRQLLAALRDVAEPAP